MDGIGGFMGNAKGFVRNPLGIVALFVSLIYGMACLVVTKGLEVLTLNERLVLIAFIVAFPLILLVVFFILVVCFPGHLYGPSDFKDEKWWVQVIFGDELRNKREKDAEEVHRSGEDVPSRPDSPAKPGTPDAGFKDNASLMARMSQIEGAALSKLNERCGLFFARDVKIGRKDRFVYCDGYCRKDGVHYIAEIKYVPTASPSRIHVIREGVGRLVSRLHNIGILEGSRLIVGVVYEGGRDETFEEKARQALIDVYPALDVVFYRTEELGVTGRQPVSEAGEASPPFST